jgi:hypothetical protein
VRDGFEPTSLIDIVAVGADFVAGSQASVTVTWDSIFADGFDGAAR